MTGHDDQSRELTRVLHDPALRLPDNLVDLESVHRMARSRQRRRTSFVAGAAVAVVAVVGLVAVRPWQGDDLAHVPDASGTVSPSIPTSPSTGGPTPTVTPPATATTVSAVTAISADQWWALARPTLPCPSPGCPLELYATTDGGHSFTVVSRSTDAKGLPRGTADLRFLDDRYAMALDPTAPKGQQLWVSDDRGKDWGPVPVTHRVVAIEAGGGGAWALVTDGSKIGAMPLYRPFFAPEDPIWLGSDNGVTPELTVQNGQALVLWFDSSGSRASLVYTDRTVDDRTNPCSPDTGIDSLSATADGLAVSCPGGMADTPYVSEDGGTSWSTLLGIDQREAQRYTVGSISAGRTAVGGQDGSITLAPPTSYDTVIKPRQADVGGNAEPWTYLGFTDPDHGFGINEAGHLFRSTDGGLTWTEVKVEGS